MPSDSTSMVALIEEIHWLSAELKNRTALRSEEQRVLLASKGLLHTLAEQGARTVPAIAEARNTSRQNIQIIANRLAQVGCVEFVPNPNHKKSELLQLTQIGAALLKSSTKQENAVLGGIAAQLGSVQLEDALQGLKALRTVLAEAEKTPRTRNGQNSGFKSPRRSDTSDNSEG